MNLFRVTKFYNNLFLRFQIQNYSAGCSQAPASSGLVIGVYDSGVPGKEQELTEAGDRLNTQTNGYIKDILKKYHIPLGKVEIFSGLGIQHFKHVAFAGLGPKDPNKLNHYEQLNEQKENIRTAMALGARAVQDRGANQISIDGVTVPEAAAEGSILGTYIYKANLSEGDKKPPVVNLFDHPDTNSWASGEINAEAQNWARFLSHSPPNLKTPTLIAQEIMDKLCKFGVQIELRSREWMKLRRMYATLSLVHGSCNPPIMLELRYCGDDINTRPIVLVGKGNTFDSGGLFLKPYKGIHEFRADMSGAASIVSTILAVARKRLPINIRSALLLYENMPAPMGLKPGDIVKDKYNRHIRISDPDNDCRVVLADIVNFVDYYKPLMVINIGSFTRSISHALGTAASGLFTNRFDLWNEFYRAGLESGDRVWKMPLWQFFTNVNSSDPAVDIDNYTCPKGGDCCQAAQFLHEFVPIEDTTCCPQRLPYAHLDCYGTGLLSQTEEEIEPYYRKGIKMGRPTRTLIQFMYQRACLLPRKKEEPVENRKTKNTKQ